MTHLAREGMQALTQEFAEAYREEAEWQKAHSKHTEKPLRPDVTPEQFRDALRAIGINGKSTAELAQSLSNALGLKSQDGRQARNILRDPANKLTEINRDKLLKRAGRMDIEAARSGDYEKAEEIYEAIRLLGYDKREERLNAAANEEFALRAVVEGFLCLTGDDRQTLLRVLCGLLDSYARYRPVGVPGEDGYSDVLERRRRADRARLVSTLIERSGLRDIRNPRVDGRDASGLDYLAHLVCGEDEHEVHEMEGNPIDLWSFGPQPFDDGFKEFVCSVLGEYVRAD